MASICLKKTEVELELVTNVDILFMFEKAIRGRICHTIHRYAEANDKYMMYYDQNKEISHILYLDANNLYRWAIVVLYGVFWCKWGRLFQILNHLKTLKYH